MVWFLGVESLINGQAFEEAIDWLKKPPESINQLIPLHRILFNSLSMTAYFARGSDDQGKLAMRQLFASGHIRPATLLRLAKKLTEINRPREAGNVLQYLLRQNPGNQAAQAETIRIALMTGHTLRAIQDSLAMLEGNTMPFSLKKELLAYFGRDRQLYRENATDLVGNILDTMAPSKKRQLLEAL